MSDRERKTSDARLRSLKFRFNLAKRRKKKLHAKSSSTLLTTPIGDESSRSSGAGGSGQTPKPWSDASIILPSKKVDYSRERLAYARYKATLVKEEPGQFVVFAGEKMIGPYDSLPAAVLAARKDFGPGPISTHELVFDDSPR